MRHATPLIALISIGVVLAFLAGSVRHFFDHGADGAVLAERELAHSMAEMVFNDPSLVTSKQTSV